MISYLHRDFLTIPYIHRWILLSPTPPVSNYIPPDQNENSSNETEEQEELEPIELVTDDLIDDEYGFVGIHIKAVYHNGWFVGKIVYYNVVLNAYNFEFNDNTSDYICPDEIDVVEVTLL